MTSSHSSSRDPVRSLFGIAVAFGLATVLLREIHGVRLAYEPLGAVAFVAWLAAGISILASLREFAREHRFRSLYFALALLAGHVLVFAKEMDRSAGLVIAGLVWVLLGTVMVVEAASLFKKSRSAEDSDDNDAAW